MMRKHNSKQLERGALLLCIGVLIALLVAPLAASAQEQPLFDLLIRAEPEQLPTYDGIVEALGEPGAALGFQLDTFAAACLDSSFAPSWVYDGGIVIRQLNPPDIRDEVYYLPFSRILNAIVSSNGTIGLLDIGGSADGFLRFRLEAGVLYILFVHLAEPDGIYGWACGDSDTLKGVLGSPSEFLTAAPPQPFAGQRFTFSTGDVQLTAVCLLPSLPSGIPDDWSAWVGERSTYAVSAGGMALVDGSDTLALLLYNQDQATVEVDSTTLLITVEGEIGARRYSIGGSAEFGTLDCGAPDESLVVPSLPIGVGSANVRVGIYCNVLTTLSRGQQFAPLMGVRVNGEIWYILTRAQLRLLDALPDAEPNDEPLLDEAFAVVSEQVVTGSLSEDALAIVDVTGTLFLPICTGGGAGASGTTGGGASPATTPETSGGDSGSGGTTGGDGGSGGAPPPATTPEAGGGVIR
jgi:hypothetical protein